MVKNIQLSSNLRLPFRGLLILVFLLIIITLLYIFVVLPSIRDDIYQEKMLHTREMIDVGISVLEHYHQMEQQQTFSREEAQRNAADMVRSIHYGENGLDYFWINDLEATVIVHPFRPDLEGEDVYDYQDPEGLYLFQEFIRLAQEEGSGHVTYYWQYYHFDDRYEEKLSYIDVFEPWDWIIGTGVYLTDLEAVIAQRRNIAVGFTALFFIILAILVFFYYRIRAQEHELLESEEKYRIIAENTADVISILDLNLRHLYVSPSVYRIKGFTPEEARAMSLEETLTPESAHRAVRKFCRQLELEKQNKGDSSKSYQVELEEYCKDGSVIWTENSVSFVHGGDNEPIGIIAISRDITERKRQQEIIEKEQKEKSIILENVAEQVTFKDTDLRLIWANNAARNRYNKEPEEYVGQKCYEAWYGTDRICDNCQVVKAIEQGRVCHGEVRSPEGEYWQETASPVFDEKGNVTGVIGTSLNITDLKLAEQELKRLNEELEQRVSDRTSELEQANKELSAFTYSVSHDLRAPLRRIEGFSKVLLEDYEDQLEGEMKGYIERIMTASLRMSELIEDMLKLSRVTRQEINIDQVDLSSMVEARINLYREENPDRIVNARIKPGLKARGDAALLRIALDNLIDNAWKFTNNEEEAIIEFGITAYDNETVFYVSDNGVGFDMDHADKIFDPFQRVHSGKDYPGTGIGLSIVQRIIERHGGQIWAEAEAAKGTIFYFTLPS